MYKIVKCPELNCWIVFKRYSDNIYYEVYRDKYKKNCKNWINNH